MPEPFNGHAFSTRTQAEGCAIIIGGAIMAIVSAFAFVYLIVRLVR